MEEEIGIEKISREAGHVRIHKIVKTEEKHFRVPVTREDVVIERVSASEEDARLSPELAFKEQTLDLPLHEEDVQVTKRARVREQIVIHPVIQAAEKEASASLRHEEAEIEDTRGRAVRAAVTAARPDRGSARRAATAADGIGHTNGDARPGTFEAGRDVRPASGRIAARRRTPRAGTTWMSRSSERVARARWKAAQFRARRMARGLPRCLVA